MTTSFVLPIRNEYVPHFHVKELGTWKRYNHWLLHWDGDDTSVEVDGVPG